MLAIRNNSGVVIYNNQSNKIKSYTGYQLRCSSNITQYQETSNKMYDMNRTWVHRFNNNDTLSTKSYHVINTVVGVNKSLEERYIREYVYKLNRSRCGLIIVKDIDECNSLINDENKTHYRLEKIGKSEEVGNDTRNTIFDDYRLLEGSTNIYQVERSWSVKKGKRYHRYSNIGEGMLNTNYINGVTKDLYIDEMWLNDPNQFAKFRTNASCILLFIDVKYLVNNYNKIGVMFNGIKSLCTQDAFNLLYDELWAGYLDNFINVNPDSRILPTPYIHAATDTNDDLREKRVTSQSYNKIEKVNAIIKISGDQNLRIGIDNTTYSDILPHCETTNKLQSYVK